MAFAIDVSKRTAIRLAYAALLVGVTLSPSNLAYCEQADFLSDMPVIEAAMIAEHAIRHGENARGMKFLREAIRSNAGDLGNRYTYERKPNSEDLAWGERQVAQLLIDRPVLTELVKDRNQIWETLCSEFGGAGRSRPVHWNSRSPEFSSAEFNLSTPAKPASIQVAGETLDGASGAMTPRSAEAILCGVVFELRNASRSQVFELLYKLAREGSISKEVFVERMYDIELETMQEVRGFYARVLLPWAAKDELATDPSIWYVQSRFWLPSQALIVDTHEDKDQYPWIPYADYYDWLRKSECTGNVD